jgi:hypothetical protein
MVTRYFLKQQGVVVRDAFCNGTIGKPANQIVVIEITRRFQNVPYEATAEFTEREAVIALKGLCRRILILSGERRLFRLIYRIVKEWKAERTARYTSDETLTEKSA